MSVESYRVAIGACGWKHSAWQVDFYPDDLPEDWHLGYYANEFPVVYVPASDWIEEQDLSGWVDDVSETFRFILELPASCLKDETLFSTALETARSLREYCLGLIFILDNVVSEDINGFTSHLDAALELTSVCVDTQGLELPGELADLLLSRDISEVRTVPGKNNESLVESALARGKLAITHVSGDTTDAAAIRRELELLLSASTPERICILCIDGEPPSLEVMRNADIILNLL